MANPHPTRLALLVLCFLLAACSDPNDGATVSGKGGIRAIHAVAELDTVTFLIEETSLASLGFKDSSGVTEYDDLEYTFNFDILLPGDSEKTRLASTTLQVDSEYEHTFILAGSLAAPEIVVWEQFGRDWTEELETAEDNGTEVTVMEVSFGNLAVLAGAVDVYIEAPGTSPAFAVPRATIGYGDLAEAVELAAGEYQIVLTPVGDPSTVLFATDPLTVSAASSNLFAIMDDGGLTTADYSIRWVNAGVELHHLDLQSEVSVVHAALGTDPVDVVIGGDFANPLVAGLAFTDASPAAGLEPGTVNFNITPASDTSVFLAERSTTVADGSINRMYVVGYPGDLQAVILSEDRRTLATHARLQVFQGAVRYTSVDLYLLDVTADISLIGPSYSSFAYGTGTGQISVEPGDYNIYVTETDTKNIVGGPYAVTLAAGEVLGAVVLDSADIQATDILFMEIASQE